MDKFWQEMTAIYLTKWSGGYGSDWSNVDGDGSVSIWYDLLIDVPWKLIQNGIEKCKRELEWPPNPAQFIKICKFKAEDVGAPPFEDAYKEACNLGKDILQDCQSGYKRTIGKEWSHAAIYQAYKSVEGWQFITDEKAKRTIFSTKYDLMIERIVNGEQLEKPERTLAIENPSGVRLKCNMTTGEKAIEEMRAKLSDADFVKKVKEKPEPLDPKEFEKLKTLEHEGETRYQYLRRIYGKR